MGSSNSTTSSRVNDIAIPYIGSFWLFLVSNILSLLCCLFVLYYFLFDRTLRQTLHNHVLIILLILCLIWDMTTVPFTMNVYVFRIVPVQTPIFCMIWKFVDSCIYTTVAKLVAWTAVERHILIFHNQWILTNKRRFFIHYLPLIIIITYGIIMYAVITFMNNCGRRFSYTAVFCGYSACMNDNVIFSLYEFFSGGLLSSFLIATGSISLVLRIVFQKRRLQQQMQWRKHRKMAIQLICITSLFYTLYLPPVLLSTAKKLGVPSSVGADYNLYAQFLSYYIIFLFPCVCIGTIPNLTNRIRNIFKYCYHRQIRITPLQ